MSFVGIEISKNELTVLKKIFENFLVVEIQDPEENFIWELQNFFMNYFLLVFHQASAN